jgi:hypothetical protein
MITDAQAKAVTAIAETTGKGVDLVRDIGAFLNRTVGTIPADLLRVGGGDWLHEVAERNLARLRARTARLLEEIEPERIAEPSPSLVLPLLQAAADESRERLQELWAALLANALVDGGIRVRRDYFEVVRQMEPLDALLLDIVRRHPVPVATSQDSQREREVLLDRETAAVGLAGTDLWISVGKLRELRCLDSHWPGALTFFGTGLTAACQPPAAVRADDDGTSSG